MAPLDCAPGFEESRIADKCGDVVIFETKACRLRLLLEDARVQLFRPKPL